MNAIGGTGAARVWTTHGYRDVMARWLREKGLDAQAVETRYRAETEEEES
jgi:putative mRNA 3-end processing factor